MCTTNLLSGPKNKIVLMIILTFQYVCRMNKQHVFDKFDITYTFYNVKKNIYSCSLAMGNREKFCCFNNSYSQIIHVSPIHENHI